MKEEILINTQVGLFFDSSIIRPDLLVGDFNVAMGNIFDQIPLILPVPNELSDVPARYPFLRTLVIQISSTFRNAFSRIPQEAF